MGVVANPYVKAIRASEQIAQWRQQGLSEEQINERARQDDLLGSIFVPVDVPGIIDLVDKGVTRENVVQLAAVVILGKRSSGAKGTVPKNISPTGAGRSGTFNEAKRQSGIPTSQQPSRILPNVDKRGNPQPGKIYEFEVPATGWGAQNGKDP